MTKSRTAITELASIALLLGWAATCSAQDRVPVSAVEKGSHDLKSLIKNLEAYEWPALARNKAGDIVSIRFGAKLSTMDNVLLACQIQTLERLEVKCGLGLDITNLLTACKERESLRDLSLTLPDVTLTDDDAALVSQLKNLQVLELNHIRLDKCSLASLSRLEQLRALRLTSAHLTDAHVPEILRIPHLEMLDIADNDVSDRVVKALTENTTLKKVGLCRTRISLYEAYYLKNARKTLEVVFFSRLPERWLRNE